MNKITARKFIKKEQLYIYPNDISPWYDKKRQLAKPFADFMGRCFLDAKIHKSIAHLKREDPDLIIGETHCHSTYSDGSPCVFLSKLILEKHIFIRSQIHHLR